MLFTLDPAALFVQPLNSLIMKAAFDPADEWFFYDGAHSRAGTMESDKFAIFASLVFIFLDILSCNEQNTPNYIEIPFVLENNRIAIEASVNNQKGRFVFDTGSFDYRNLRKGEATGMYYEPNIMSQTRLLKKGIMVFLVL